MVVKFMLIVESRLKHCGTHEYYQKIEIEYFVETLSKILIMSQSKIPIFLNYPNTVTTLKKIKYQLVFGVCVLYVSIVVKILK